MIIFAIYKYMSVKKTFFLFEFYYKKGKMRFFFQFRHFLAIFHTLFFFLLLDFIERKSWFFFQFRHFLVISTRWFFRFFLYHKNGRFFFLISRFFRKLSHSTKNIKSDTPHVVYSNVERIKSQKNQIRIPTKYHNFQISFLMLCF